MKTHNSIQTIPHKLRGCDFTSLFSPSTDQSAAVKSTFGSTTRPPLTSGRGGRKQYVGPIDHLHGKTALVEPRMGAAGEVMAQFEELHLQEARGWWQFSAVDFETLESTGKC